MKRNKYLFVCFMLLAIVLAGGIFTGLYVNLNGQVHKKHEIRVVTSFTPSISQRSMWQIPVRMWFLRI